MCQRRTPLRIAVQFLTAWALFSAVSPQQVGAQPAPAPRPATLNVPQERFPEFDAVILRWDQSWSLARDGRMSRRDHQWLKLFNTRPGRRVADRRITYHKELDTVTIHTAQTIMPDGRIIKVPDYSFNTAAARDVAGWPEYAGWEQTVVSFSGVSDGAVLELDYEVASKPGAQPSLWADLRLHEDYPTLERNISLTTPDGMTPRYFCTGVPVEGLPLTETSYAAQLVDGQLRMDRAGKTTLRWTFKDLEGRPSEPQSAPWQQRCGRLLFATDDSPEAWVGDLTRWIDGAGRGGPELTAFAKRVVGAETDPAQQVQQIADYLKDTFQVISSELATRSRACRAAVDVLAGNYGNRLESSAVMLGAARSLGLEARPLVAVAKDAWRDEVPTDSAFEGAVIHLQHNGEDLYVHPTQGVLQDPGRWGRRWLLGIGLDGKLTRHYLASRGEKARSVMIVNSNLTLDDNGGLSGDVRLELTGAYYDPESLRSAAKQKTFVERAVKQLFSGLKVTSYAITTLSAETLKATAKISSDGPLPAAGDQNLLSLGDGPAFLSTFALPLGRYQRKTAVHTAGSFEERFNLTIELGDSWAAGITARSLGEVSGDWGRINQTSLLDGTLVRFQRRVEVTTDNIPADDFSVLRTAVNTLRTPAWRTLAFSKSGS